MKGIMVIAALSLLFPACLCSRDTKNPPLNGHDNTPNKRIDTSDIEYLKKLPVHLPDESPGHNDENVVGAGIIKSTESKKVFFEFINIIPSDYAARYDFYSQRIKKDIELRQNIKSAEEYKKYWEQIRDRIRSSPFQEDS